MFSPYLSKINNKHKQDKGERLIFNLSILGILLFLALAVTLPFRDQLLNLLFPKQPAQAVETWVEVGTHPGAAAQPTSQGKALRTLQVWNGKIYAGYGDFDANTGPIAISPFDPIAKTFTQEHISQTEAIYHYRIFSNKMYAPAIDPRGSRSIGYAVENSPGSWQDVTTVLPEHGYDMATLTGTDLWLVGSDGDFHAVAWRSLDGGTTWTKSLDNFKAGATLWRFHFAGVLNGKLYVQAKDDLSATVDAVSKVFDGTSWSDGPNMLPTSNTGGWRPMSFAGKLVYLPSNLGGPLQQFDGTTFSNILSPEGAATFQVYDMNVEGNELFVLSTQPGTSNRAIYKTTDLTNWTKVASNVPAFTSWSFALLNGKYYIGTSDSKIFEYDPGIVPTIAPTLTTIPLTPSPTATPTATITPLPPTNTPTPTPTSIPGANLLLNSSFETNNNGFPANWQTRTEASWDNTVSHTGIASLKAIGPAGNFTFQALIIKPSTTYTLKGWIKTQGVSRLGGVFLRLPAVNQTTPLLGTNDWTKVTKTFTTPVTVTTPRIDLVWNLNTGETAWFDDVAFCEGSCAGTGGPPPATPTPTSTPLPTASPTPTPVPPTNTPIPTNTPVPPTATPTNIPTSTPPPAGGPTNTPIPPTPTSAPAPAPCTITAARWSLASLTEGQSVTLTVNASSGCDGKQIQFEVRESDLMGDDPVLIEPASAPIQLGGAGRFATTTWIAEWQNDCGGLCNPPEYFFNASVVGQGGTFRSADPLLVVNQLPSPSIPTPTPPGDLWIAVGTHPQAAAQPTVIGKKIATLIAWNGNLYAGYGDYDVNTGPIAVSPFDPVSRTFTNVHTAATDAIYNYRIIGDKLYAPATDSHGSPGSDYAVGDSNGVWQDKKPITTTHTFDMVTLTGTDLWIVGSQGDNAGAWRSLDGGATWQQMLSVGPISGITGDFARFYFAGVYNGKLYVQAKDQKASTHPQSKVFDGTTWSDGPRLVPSFGLGYRPLTFAGKLVYTSGELGGALLQFDGTSYSQTPSPDGALSFSGYQQQIINNELYFLAGQPGTTLLALYKTPDLVNWSKVANNIPNTARSFAVLKGKYYIGTTDSQIMEANIPAPTPIESGPTTKPPTATPTGTGTGSTCQFTSASWGTTGIVDEGTVLTLRVTGNDACNGKKVGIRVREEDSLLEGLFDEDARVQPSPLIMSGGRGETRWVAEWQNDCGGRCLPPEYFFNAFLIENPSVIRRSSDPLIQVNKEASAAEVVIKVEGLEAQLLPTAEIVIVASDGTTRTLTDFPLVFESDDNFKSYIASNLPPGDYTIFIKVQGRLRKKFTIHTKDSVTAPEVLNTTPIPAGDVNGDNVINALDIGKLQEDYSPASPRTSGADLNGDGFVDAVDAKFVLDNYLQRGE